ncbi:MAG: 4-hydroxythreonine-4-phosphate dehydrogenase PdxA [Deltaproteobacteria bacterium]|nr:4-hydroxythreonine-4-phosphate dehydrogenase PdxA [Deltaproteobacteria bacterium]
MILALTPGMGIGPEVTARSLSESVPAETVVLLGDGAIIAAALDAEGVEHQQCSTVDTAPVGVSILDTQGAEPAPVRAIRVAAEACLAGAADAMVTGPIHKEKLIAQGFSFRGHTDMLGHICGVDSVMAFAGGQLRVALVTAHVPLLEVDSLVTRERVIHVTQTAGAALRDDLGIHSPRIAVCGVNPHAGESGVLGTVDLEQILPACSALRAEGWDVDGPVSAETAFMSAIRKEYDLVVAMYHDQGLVPLKVVDFGRSVNWTLGLPIVRTSVDHGTAFDLVGTGRADHQSMQAAIQLAVQIVERRNLL